MDEIRYALNAGKEVITHTGAVQVPSWSGAGYIITDPQTGDGAYKISGGGNGSYFAGLFLGMFLILLGVFTAVGTGGLAIPFLLSALAHASLIHFLIADDSGGVERTCFLAGLFAGLSIVLFTSGNPLSASLLELLGIMVSATGYTEAILDLQNSRENCLGG